MTTLEVRRTRRGTRIGPPEPPALWAPVVRRVPGGWLIADRSGLPGRLAVVGGPGAAPLVEVLWGETARRAFMTGSGVLEVDGEGAAGAATAFVLAGGLRRQWERPGDPSVLAADEIMGAVRLADALAAAGWPRQADRFRVLARRRLRPLRRAVRWPGAPGVVVTDLSGVLEALARLGARDLAGDLDLLRTDPAPAAASGAAAPPVPVLLGGVAPTGVGGFAGTLTVDDSGLPAGLAAGGVTVTVDGSAVGVAIPLRRRARSLPEALAAELVAGLVDGDTGRCVDAAGLRLTATTAEATLRIPEAGDRAWVVVVGRTADLDAGPLGDRGLRRLRDALAGALDATRWWNSALVPLSGDVADAWERVAEAAAAAHRDDVTSQARRLAGDARAGTRPLDVGDGAPRALLSERWAAEWAVTVDDPSPGVARAVGRPLLAAQKELEAAGSGPAGSRAAGNLRWASWTVLGDEGMPDDRVVALLDRSGPVLDRLCDPGW